MKYKLIKRFPGSHPVGTIVEKHYPGPEKTHFCYKGTYTFGMSSLSFTRARDQIEGFEEFWQPLSKEWIIPNANLKIVYEGSSYVTLCYSNGNRSRIAFSIIQLLVNDPFKVDKVAGFNLKQIHVDESSLSYHNNMVTIPIGTEHVCYWVKEFTIGCTTVSYALVKEIYEWIKSN